MQFYTPAVHLLVEKHWHLCAYHDLHDRPSQEIVGKIYVRGHPPVHHYQQKEQFYQSYLDTL